MNGKLKEIFVNQKETEHNSTNDQNNDKTLVGISNSDSATLMPDISYLQASPV